MALTCDRQLQSGVQTASFRLGFCKLSMASVERICTVCLSPLPVRHDRIERAICEQPRLLSERAGSARLWFHSLPCDGMHPLPGCDGPVASALKGVSKCGANCRVLKALTGSYLHMFGSLHASTARLRASVLACALAMARSKRWCISHRSREGLRPYSAMCVVASKLHPTGSRCLGQR